MHFIQRGGGMSKQTDIAHIGIAAVLEANRLTVPPNQRPYSWKEQQIDDLLIDLNTAIDGNDKEYFLGSIVLTTGDSSRPSVVDGQQRLASVTMIYAAMRDYLDNISDKEKSISITDKYLRNSDVWAGTHEPKLKLGAQDSVFFERYVLAPLGSPERDISKINKMMPDSNKRIATAFDKIKNFFSQQLESTNTPLSILKKWDEYLKNSVKVLLLKVEDESNAYKIFETLNDRGLDLATSDLLKNYLLGKAGTTGFESVRHHWTSALSKIGESDESVFKKYIHHFWASREGLTRERQLYENIKSKIRTQREAIKLASELFESSSNYAAIVNPSHDLWAPMGSAAQNAISQLQDLKMDQYKPLLLACMDTFGMNQPEEITKMLRALVSWSVRFRVTQQLGSSRQARLYQEGGKKVRNEGYKKANAVINALIESVPSDSQFRKAFSGLEEDNSKVARYYLHELERSYRVKAGITAHPPTDEKKINLEHVLPKQPDMAMWNSFKRDSIDVYCYRLGNQVLLEKKKNEKLGNCSFEAKKTVYLGSAVETTRLVGQFNCWSEEQVEQRQADMAELALLAWPIHG
jgi:hypothetical protein